MCENPRCKSSTGKVLAQSAASFKVNEDGSTTIVYRPYPTTTVTRYIILIYLLGVVWKWKSNKQLFAEEEVDARDEA